MKLDWENLRRNKCPKCSKDLAKSINIKTMIFECPCGFKISQKRYKEIVTNTFKPRFEKHYRPDDEVPEN